jgi:hypothetical protein
MAIGPGKYDEIATAARKGVVLMVLDGEFGYGFSAQLPPEYYSGLPEVLRQVAEQLEAEMKNMI